MSWPSNRAPFTGTLWAYFLIMLILTSKNFQVSSGSRRFLTGLIIGTLLARNGMPAYPAPAGAPHYQPSHHHHQQQQPLFIIIPSASGKSYKPQVVAPYANMYSPPPLDYHGHSNRRSIFKSTSSKKKNLKMASSWNDNNNDNNKNNSQIFAMLSDSSGGSSIPIANPIRSPPTGETVYL